MARTLMRHARPRSSMVCLSFTGIPCSSQAIRKGSYYTFITITTQRTRTFTAPLAMLFQRLLGTDCFVHRLQMGNVHCTNSPYEIMPIRHTSPKALCKYINYSSPCQTISNVTHRSTAAFYVYTHPCVSFNLKL